MKKIKIQIKKLMNYDPNTGIFYDLKTEKPLGILKNDGHIYIWIDKTKYKAEVLAWRYVTGEWPKYPIIHIDGVKSNNWITNLKLVTKRKAGKNNNSKIPGVYWNNKNKNWRVQISINRKNCSIGSFKNFDLAVIARCNAELENGYSDSLAQDHVKNLFL